MEFDTFSFARECSNPQSVSTAFHYAELIIVIFRLVDRNIDQSNDQRIMYSLSAYFRMVSLTMDSQTSSCFYCLGQTGH